MLGSRGTFILKWELANEFGLLQDNYSLNIWGLDSWIFGYEKSHTVKFLDILNPTTQKTKLSS